MVKETVRSLSLGRRKIKGLRIEIHGVCSLEIYSPCGRCTKKLMRSKVENC